MQLLKPEISFDYICIGNYCMSVRDLFAAYETFTVTNNSVPVHVGMCILL